MIDEVCKVVFVVGFVAASVIRRIHVRHRIRGDVVRSRQGVLDMLLVSLAGVGMTLPLVYIFSPWLRFADYEMPVWAEAGCCTAGTVTFAFALWLLWRSHVDLGRNWSPFVEVREGHALVTRGVYGHVRHPMYAAHALWAIAQALLLRNWLAGPAFLVTLLPFYMVRLPREERMLLEQFGEGYRDYMACTGRIVPPLTWRKDEGRR